METDECGIEVLKHTKLKKIHSIILSSYDNDDITEKSSLIQFYLNLKIKNKTHFCAKKYQLQLTLYSVCKELVKCKNVEDKTIDVSQRFTL